MTTNDKNKEVTIEELMNTKIHFDEKTRTFNVYKKVSNIPTDDVSVMNIPIKQFNQQVNDYELASLKKRKR